MIKLITDPWCENCPEFEPNIEKGDRVVGGFDFCTPEKTFTNTTVTCIHRNRCMSIKDYLANQKEEQCPK